MRGGADGFSSVEMLVALTIALVVSGSAFALMLPSQSLATSRSEAADMQQRLRVAADTLYQRLVAAGAGAYGGMGVGPLSDSVAPLLPYRASGTSPDPPGSFKSDTITILSVPKDAAQPIGTTYWLKTDNSAATYQLMAVDTTAGVDMPVVDHLVALAFEYYGDPQPPMMRKPLADPVGPWTTYGPKPASTAVAPFEAGENCLFVNDGSPTPQPRLAVLGPASASVVALTSAQLTDGPWCPNDGAGDRWDADLLRIRSLSVRVRVQAALSTLRGPASALFAHGGTSRGGHQWVPDLEIRFQVSPRNLNLVR